MMRWFATYAPTYVNALGWTPWIIANPIYVESGKL